MLSSDLPVKILAWGFTVILTAVTYHTGLYMRDRLVPSRVIEIQDQRLNAIKKIVNNLESILPNNGVSFPLSTNPENLETQTLDDLRQFLERYLLTKSQLLPGQDG